MVRKFLRGSSLSGKRVSGEPHRWSRAEACPLSVEDYFVAELAPHPSSLEDLGDAPDAEVQEGGRRCPCLVASAVLRTLQAERWTGIRVRRSFDVVGPFVDPSPVAKKPAAGAVVAAGRVAVGSTAAAAIASADVDVQGSVAGATACHDTAGVGTVPVVLAAAFGGAPRIVCAADPASADLASVVAGWPVPVCVALVGDACVVPHAVARGTPVVVDPAASADLASAVAGWPVPVCVALVGDACVVAHVVAWGAPVVVDPAASADGQVVGAVPFGADGAAVESPFADDIGRVPVADNVAERVVGGTGAAVADPGRGGGSVVEQAHSLASRRLAAGPARCCVVGL
ncbi:hypothetical protein CBR_g4316 [Chara braunii]|uniref:Uncharacterized protein n=1 Tax=Chara braunii TaxID=69332 RepID=A0A388JRF2_CHABU|nr:hypothetical protein CBR_g4316 [Chara braunii]|eukprot:GBG60358.1 hypothetical protein CBR_g4316 [Chara braunii]